MIKLALFGIVGLILLIAFIIIVRNKPDFWFWIFLNLFFDPGGYAYGFLGGTLVGPLHITDVFISGILVCLISAKVNWNFVFEDLFLKKFLFYLFLFALYYFIVYGGVVPYIQHDFDYSTFIVKNRVFAYGFVILIAVYVFSLKNLYYFYTSTLFIGAVCLTLFFISLFTGLQLTPVEESARYTGEEAMRVSMIGYGLFNLLFPVALITYLVSRKVNVILKYKSLLYYSGIIMIITLLITLTRRTQIDIIGMILLLSLIVSYLFRTGKLSSILKVLMPALIVVLVLFFTFPKYAGYVVEIGEDTFLLITTGKDSRGESDQRVSGSNDYEIVNEYISENLLFGTGYTHLFWQDGRATSSRGVKFAVARDAAGEVPIYLLLFSFGLTGAILMMPLYFLMGSLFFKLIKLLRFKLINFLSDPLTIIFAIYVLLTITTKFTINLYSLSGDFTGGNLSYTAVLVGIGFAVYRTVSVNAYIELQ
jgi:hypothetical protein